MNEIQKEAFRYYNMGLNSKEIGKLLDLSFRTVQNWSAKFKWKHNRTPPSRKLKAKELRKKGFSFVEIAKRFQVSTQTIKKWLKEIS